jgi:hypothetical protein
VEKREVRAGTIAYALEGWGESGVRADVVGRYLPPPHSALPFAVALTETNQTLPQLQPGGE